MENTDQKTVTYPCTSDEQVVLKMMVQNLTEQQLQYYTLKEDIERGNEQLKAQVQMIDKTKAAMEGAVNMLAFNRGESVVYKWALSRDCSSIRKVEENGNTTLG